MNILNSVTRDTASSYDACVIWLHGLGADGHDFYDVVPMLQLPGSLNVRFIFPHAPVKAVTVNGGMEMPAWYDIYGIGEHYQEDKAGIISSADAVEALINQEIEAGISASRIILAGFSQGGAVSLYSACRYNKPLAGVLALSTYLPLADSVLPASQSANKNTPFLMMHGTDDQTIPVAFGLRSRDHLLTLGYQVSWQDYAMPHSVCPDQCLAIGQWISNLL